MIAAIYARKSTEQRHVDEDAKSVARQVAHAKAFARTKGWTTADRYVFTDDGVSGTEFERRAGLQSLLAALKPKPSFQILIISEQKSLGREMSETAYLIKQLAKAGIEIFEYVHGRSLTPRDATAKLLSSVQGFADEDHAVKSGERTHEALSDKANRGYVTGGRVFGYRNVDVYNGVDAHGRPLRSHVERVVEPTEAAVIKRIFELYDSGEGLKRISKILTHDDAPTPTPFVRRDATKVGPVRGWAPATVRSILTRELYHGVCIWNKTRKRDTFRQVNQRPRPESEWQRIPAEHLRIVAEPLWQRVQQRRRETEGRAARFASGRLSGRPPKQATQNLLAGLATCAHCGGGFVVETSSRKRGRIPEYVCYRHRANGGCTNAFRLSVAEMNEMILSGVEEHALTPEAIEQVIHLSERDDVMELQDKLERERKDVEKRVGRVVAAIETGGDAAPLVAKLKELEARLHAIDREARSLRPVPRLAPAVIEDRLAEWRRLLRSSTTQGRTVLQRILRGRITFTLRTNPVTGEVDGYDFEAPTRFDRLFTGIAVERPAGVDEGPLGTEWITAEDTFDGDYGRLLEQVYVKGMASPTGFEPVFWP